MGSGTHLSAQSVIWLQHWTWELTLQVKSHPVRFSEVPAQSKAESPHFGVQLGIHAIAVLVSEGESEFPCWGEPRTMRLVPAYTDKASLRGSSARTIRG